MAAVVMADDCMYFVLATNGEVRWLIIVDDCHLNCYNEGMYKEFFVSYYFDVRIWL